MKEQTQDAGNDRELPLPELAGKTVSSVEVVEGDENYVVLNFTDGSTLYAGDEPTAYRAIPATPAILTKDDVEACLADDRHLGVGYATSRDLSPSKADRLDRCVVAVANELGLDRESLFHWTNSKYGRWLTDAVLGNDAPINAETVRRLLNAEAVEVAQDGLR